MRKLFRASQYWHCTRLSNFPIAEISEAWAGAFHWLLNADF